MKFFFILIFCAATCLAGSFSRLSPELKKAISQVPDLKPVAAENLCLYETAVKITDILKMKTVTISGNRKLWEFILTALRREIRLLGIKIAFLDTKIVCFSDSLISKKKNLPRISKR